MRLGIVYKPILGDASSSSRTRESGFETSNHKDDSFQLLGSSEHLEMGIHNTMDSGGIIRHLLLSTKLLCRLDACTTT